MTTIHVVNISCILWQLSIHHYLQKTPPHYSNLSNLNESTSSPSVSFRSTFIQCDAINTNPRVSAIRSLFPHVGSVFISVWKYNYGMVQSPSVHTWWFIAHNLASSKKTTLYNPPIHIYICLCFPPAFHYLREF
jgi:hypothetical protein